MHKQISIGVINVVMFCLVFTGGMASNAWSASVEEINAGVDVTLERFYGEVKDGKKLVQEAKGVLVFPNVYKAGFVFGGEYGEGALRVNGKIVDYYNTATGSFGFQIGAQKKSIILIFMQEEVFNKFRQTANWKVGADASVTLINIGADGSIDTAKYNEPILGFVIGQKGLMYNLTLEGTKITKLNK
jgi:lipid-binding SYLF domain-containing protein